MCYTQDAVGKAEFSGLLGFVPPGCISRKGCICGSHKAIGLDSAVRNKQTLLVLIGCPGGFCFYAHIVS